MGTAIKDLTAEELRELIATTVAESFQDVLEDFIALASPTYLKSIEESRRDYETGNVKPLDEALDV